MTTANLLMQSVKVAGEFVTPQVGTLAEYVEELKLVDPELLAPHEQEILKVAEAATTTIPLINVATAIAAGGAHKNSKLPKLAIASYEMSMKREKVFATVRTNGSVRFVESNWSWEYELPAHTLPRGGFIDGAEGSTVVPLVPLKLRQKETDDVILLFEVENWKLERLQPADPYLLRLVAGEVYAVIGTWDITQKELKAYQAAKNLGI